MSLKKFDQMPESCPVCGQHYEPETGQITSLEPPVFQIQGGKPIVIHPAQVKQGDLRLGVQ